MKSIDFINFAFTILFLSLACQDKGELTTGVLYDNIFSSLLAWLFKPLAPLAVSVPRKQQKGASQGGEMLANPKAHFSPCFDGRLNLSTLLSHPGAVVLPYPGSSVLVEVDVLDQCYEEHGLPPVSATFSHYRCAAAKKLDINDRKLYKKGLQQWEHLRSRGVNAIYVHLGRDGIETPHLYDQAEFERNPILRHVLVAARRIYKEGLFRRDDHYIKRIEVGNHFQGEAPEGVVRVAASLVRSPFVFEVLQDLTKGMKQESLPELRFHPNVSLTVREIARECGRKQQFYKIKELDE